MASAPRRRICVEDTRGGQGLVGWRVALGLGMTNVFIPFLPVERNVNQSISSAWHECGQELVACNQDFNLSSAVIVWKLESQHRFARGWDLAATMEIELSLSDDKGNVLHSARYSSTDRQTKRTSASSKFLLKMHDRALQGCLKQMTDDPKWLQALSAVRPEPK